MNIMRLALVCQVRNAQDILPAFLAHARAFFDIALFAEHGSLDNTRALLDLCCSDKPDFLVLTCKSNGFYPKVVANLLCREAFARGADHVFFLDSDEFLYVRSRSELEQMLERTTANLKELRWKNAVFEPIPPGQRILSFEDRFYVRRQPSEHAKIVVSREFHERQSGLYELQKGCHQIKSAEAEEIFSTDPLGYILHLPIRTIPQFYAKVLMGAANNLADSNGVTGESIHYGQMLNMLDPNENAPDKIRYFSSHYGESIGCADAQTAVFLEDYDQDCLGSVGIDHAFFERAIRTVPPAIVPIEQVLGELLARLIRRKREPDKVAISGSEIVFLEGESTVGSEPVEEIDREGTTIEELLIRRNSYLEARHSQLKKDFNLQLAKQSAELSHEIQRRDETLAKKRNELVTSQDKIAALESTLRQAEHILNDQHQRLSILEEHARKPAR